MKGKVREHPGRLTDDVEQVHGKRDKLTRQDPAKVRRHHASDLPTGRKIDVFARAHGARQPDPQTAAFAS